MTYVPDRWTVLVHARGGIRYEIDEATYDAAVSRGRMIRLEGYEFASIDGVEIVPPWSIARVSVRGQGRAPKRIDRRVNTRLRAVGAAMIAAPLVVSVAVSVGLWLW